MIRHTVTSKLKVSKEAYLDMLTQQKWSPYGLPNFSSDYNGTIDLNHVSHKIHEVDYNEPLNSLVIQFTILDTYQGRLIQSLLDRGMEFESKFQAMGVIDLATNSISAIHTLCFVLHPAQLSQSPATVGNLTLQQIIQGFYG